MNIYTIQLRKPQKGQINVFKRLLWLCCVLACMAILVSAQTPAESIEIEGVPVHTGISVSEALLLFKGKAITRNEKTLLITVPTKVGTDTLSIIHGKLFITNERVSGVCRPWNYSGSGDSELARVLLAALLGPAPNLTAQPALITTSVDRGSNQTVEDVTFQIGRRTIQLSRQVVHRDNGPTFTEVEECLWP
jgi:hypothetical protein